MHWCFLEIWGSVLSLSTLAAILSLFLSLFLSFSLSLSISVYIYRERDTDRQTETETDRITYIYIYIYIYIYNVLKSFDKIYGNLKISVLVHMTFEPITFSRMKNYYKHRKTAVISTSSSVSSLLASSCRSFGTFDQPFLFLIHIHIVHRTKNRLDEGRPERHADKNEQRLIPPSCLWIIKQDDRTDKQLANQLTSRRFNLVLLLSYTETTS